jgi:chromosome segregation ATPase
VALFHLREEIEMLAQKAKSIENTIANIRDALAVNPDPGFPNAERAARQDAAAAVENCKRGVAEARRRHPTFPPVHPDVARAEEELARAEEQLRSAVVRLASARDARAAAFAAGVRTHLDAAAPHLSEVVGILDDALRPLVNLRDYAGRQGLALPRSLEPLSSVEAGVRALRSIIN